jgi:LPS sulfotransferase NodH
VPKTTSTLLRYLTKAMRRMSLYATLAAHRLLTPFGHHDFVRFVVLTRSRTGSNLLLSFLNSHPNVFCEGEIFSKLKGTDPIKRLNNTFGKQPRHVRAKGFKIFYYHPLDADAVEFWAELERRTEFRIIHLTRDNILRTLLSRKIAGIQGAWTGTRFDQGETADKQVSFHADELEEGFRQTQAWQDSAAARFAGHPMLQLTYEGLTENPLDSYRALSTFLGLPASELRTSLNKQNPESFRRLIRNYDELKQRFTGSPWDKYFDE